MLKLAGSSPFAGLRRSSAAIKAAEDDKKDDDKKNDESKKSKAEDDKDDDKKDDDKKSKSKSKKADPEDGDDDSDRKDEDEPDARAARARERGRIRAICEAGLEVGNPDAAYHLAVGSNMSRKNAIAMLHSIGPAKAAAPRDGLRERMATVVQPEIGAGGAETAAPNDPKALAARIVAARRKADGEAA